MYINGHDNKVDVIQNVIESIEDSKITDAVDMLNQLKDIELKSTVYDNKVYDQKQDKFISFDEFQANKHNQYKINDKLENRITTLEHNHGFLESKVNSDIDIALNLEAEEKRGK
tara:strand:+ start:584 stop:925 length:342 start_codon:yes stop_codon:yes gene_type:complete